MTHPQYSHRTMYLNIVLFYPTLFLGGYLLQGKSMVLFLVYSIMLVLTILTGRYVICRACHYYGKACPSFGFSYLARIFPKDETGNFNGRAALIETRIITGCLLLPVLSLVLSWFGMVEKYSFLEYNLMVIYVALLISVDVVHRVTGCNKCEIKDCPLSKGGNVQ